jgi:hypothetical protein
VRVAIVIAGIALSGLVAVVPSRAVEETIEPLNPTGVEQRVDVIGGGDREENVRGVDEQTVEDVSAAEPPGPVAKTASTVGKVVLGVTGAGIAIGVMIASLLFF